MKFKAPLITTRACVDVMSRSSPHPLNCQDIAEYADWDLGGPELADQGASSRGQVTQSRSGSLSGFAEI